MEYSFFAWSETGLKQRRGNYQSGARRETGVEDDGVLFISQSVSTPPYGCRDSDRNNLISYQLQMAPCTQRQNKVGKEGEIQWKDGINNRRCRASKQPIDLLILPGGGRRMTQNLREIINAYSLVDRNPSHLSLLVQDTTYIIAICSPVRDDVSGVDQ
jgi:hypothetical protein